MRMLSWLAFMFSDREHVMAVARLSVWWPLLYWWFGSLNRLWTRPQLASMALQQVAGPQGRPMFLLEAYRERDLEAELNVAASYEPPQLPGLTPWHLQFLRRQAGHGESSPRTRHICHSNLKAS